MRKQRVRELMLAAGQGDDRVLQLCTSAVGALAVDGVGLSMSNGPGEHSKVAATDDVSDRIEDLQVLLRAGTVRRRGGHRGAGARGRPGRSRRRDPLADLHAGGGGAGRVRILRGSADRGGDAAGRDGPLPDGTSARLHPAQVAEAQDYASAAVNMLLERPRGIPVGDAPAGRAGWAASSAVHQATGMVMVQMATDAEGAFAALRARAYQEGRSLAEVASRRARSAHPHDRWGGVTIVSAAERDGKSSGGGPRERLLADAFVEHGRHAGRRLRRARLPARPRGALRRPARRRRRRADAG